jgi:lipopolysaccharide transport system ATP-binding protein
MNAITVTGLSKRYLLQHADRPRYESLRDALASRVRGLARRVTGGSSSGDFAATESFWALRDVGFAVGEGERLGIVGRNGAGKSTLLKLLSRITDPSEGRIELRGRVASLLEVGTGFHPELTGRENIYLNATILGMNRREIARRFDEIVAFAEVDRFLDTPVKRYSSGMYVRLAFSVAAHLDPDILIVDEVLAVGDVRFQEKCLARLGQLSGTGRTVVFVTHNMDALLSLCTRGIVLDRGRVAFDGPAAGARQAYLSGTAGSEYSVYRNSGRGGSGGAAIQDVWLATPSGVRLGAFGCSAAVHLCLHATVSETYSKRDDIDVAFAIDSENGARLFTALSTWSGTPMIATDRQLRVACALDGVPLVPGRYLVSASIVFRGDTLDSITHCAAFDLLPEGEGMHAHRPSGFGALDLPRTFHNLPAAARADA